MFTVSEIDAAAVRAMVIEGGEFAAAIELRRRYRGLLDNARAREMVRAIASWQPLPDPPGNVVPLRPARR
jgi:hypothetical protein